LHYSFTCLPFFIVFNLNDFFLFFVSRKILIIETLIFLFRQTNNTHISFRFVLFLHTEQTEVNILLSRSTTSSSQGLSNNLSSIFRSNHTIIPESSTAEVATTFVIVLLLNLILEGLNFLLRLTLELGVGEGEHSGGLVATHHGDAAVGPHEQEARIVGATTHTVVTSTIRATDQDSDLGDIGGGDGGDELGAVLGDTTAFVILTNHETGDVLEEEEGNTALRAEFDEVSTLQGGFGVENTVIGDDTDGKALDMSETADKSGAVEVLELIESGAIDDTSDDGANVEGGDDGGSHVRDETAEFLSGVEGLLPGGLDLLGSIVALLEVQVLNDTAAEVQGVHIISSHMVSDTRLLAVESSTAELFSSDDVSSGGLDERRTAQEDGTGLLNNDGFVGHAGDVGTTSGARAHDDSDLGNALSRHVGLVVEDATEVKLVGEDISLAFEVSTSGVDEVDAGEVVLFSDLLGAEVLLDCDGVVGASLHGGVVGDDHATNTVDTANTSDDTTTSRGLVAVELVTSERRKLHEGCVGVDKVLNTFTSKHFTAGFVEGASLLVTFSGAVGVLFDDGLDLSGQFVHASQVFLEGRISGVGGETEDILDTFGV